MRPLHTGDFGGIWVKLIWFVFGLLLSMMVLSGLLIWSKRTAQPPPRWSRRQAPGAPAETGQAGAGNGQPDRGGTAMSKAAVAQPVSPLRQFLAALAFPPERSGLILDPARLHATLFRRHGVVLW